jgi:hypothetical protein
MGPRGLQGAEGATKYGNCRKSKIKKEAAYCPRVKKRDYDVEIYEWSSVPEQ